MRPTYEQLEDEVAVLRRRLIELSSVTVADRIRRIVRLTQQEARLLAFLHGRELASKEAIYTAVFEDAKGDGPWPTIVTVVICRLRKSLQHQGVPGEIKTVGRAGYEMSPAMHLWLSQRLGVESDRFAA